MDGTENQTANEISRLASDGLGDVAGVRRIVRLEAALLAVVGTIVGLGIALAGGWALIAVTGGTELTSVAIPWTSIGIIALGAIVAGTVAAAYPAWRASRQPVLEAIAAS